MSRNLLSVIALGRRIRINPSERRVQGSEPLNPLVELDVSPGQEADPWGHIDLVPGPEGSITISISVHAKSSQSGATKKTFTTTIKLDRETLNEISQLLLKQAA